MTYHVNKYNQTDLIKETQSRRRLQKYYLKESLNNTKSEVREFWILKL